MNTQQAQQLVVEAEATVQSLYNEMHRAAIYHWGGGYYGRVCRAQQVALRRLARREALAARLPLPVAKTTLGQWIAKMIAAIDAGELLPCRHCGAYGGCDCEDWIEWIAAPNPDPHGDLSVWLEGEIPF